MRIAGAGNHLRGLVTGRDHDPPGHILKGKDVPAVFTNGRVNDGSGNDDCEEKQYEERIKFHDA
jgi:hypothetical protein